MDILLQTPRLTLRAFTVHDAALLAALDNDGDVLRYVGPALATSLQEYEEFIRAVQTRYYDAAAQNSSQSQAHGFWAAEERESGQFIGWFLLRPSVEHRFADIAGFEAGQIEIGYRFHTAAHGRGFATEGAQALIQQALLEESTTAIVSIALVENRASTRVMEKIGLRVSKYVNLPGYSGAAVTYILQRPSVLSA